jgi:Cu/Ag efflux protein CusF
MENYMRNRINLKASAIFLNAAIVVGMTFFISLSGCGSPKPAQQEQGPRRFSMHGRVVSVEKAKQQVVVDHGEIPGFMMAMTMGYAVKNTNLLDPLSAEDQITADVLVNGNDVWLENIVVVKKAERKNAPSSNKPQPAAAVPAKQ